MSKENIAALPQGNAICYSGYRDGQNPGEGIYPSYEQVKEDLLILQKNWKYIRMYDCNEQEQTVLDVIKNEKIDLKVMLGASLGAEVNNPDCPWKAWYTQEQLDFNKINNSKQVDKLIKMANANKDLVFAVSAGNEASSYFTDHMVPTEKVIDYVKRLKDQTTQPVTYCDVYYTWNNKLSQLAKEVDFISVHTYPIWENKNIDKAIESTKEDFKSVTNKYPDKPAILTEVGWTTMSDGKAIPEAFANEKNQKNYYDQISKWSKDNGVLTFIFEAFDENWKGSSNTKEPEKHWGLFTVNREPKVVMKDLYKELAKTSHIKDRENQNKKTLTKLQEFLSRPKRTMDCRSR